MTHRTHPSNITKLLSAEKYRILTQEPVLKVSLWLLLLLLRCAHTEPLLHSQHIRGPRSTPISRRFIRSEYFMLKKYILFLNSGPVFTKPTSWSRVFVLYSLNIYSEIFFLLLTASEVQMDYKELNKVKLPSF